VLAYIAELHRENPRDLIVVYIPEYVVGTGGSTCCTTSRAAPQGPAAVPARREVTSVPWQLESSSAAEAKEAAAAGSAANLTGMHALAARRPLIGALVAVAGLTGLTAVLRGLPVEVSLSSVVLL